MSTLVNVISFFSNLFTIIASGIAIYVFFWKKAEIASIFNLLINYTYQLSLSEIKEKIERLNEYNAKNTEECEQVVNILNEIVGQIRGNARLKAHFSDMLQSIESLAAGRIKLTEPRKRALISELRERLRHLNVKSIDLLVGDSK